MVESKLPDTYFFHKDNVSVDLKDKADTGLRDKSLRTCEIHSPIFSHIYPRIAIEVQNNCTFFGDVDMNRVERFSCHRGDRDHHGKAPGKYVFHKPISSGTACRKTNFCRSIFWWLGQFDRKSIWI